MELLGRATPTIGNESHRRTFTAICHGELPQVPWHLILSRDQYRAELYDMIGKAWDALEVFHDNKYGPTYLEMRGLLQGLSRAKINGKLLEVYNTGESNGTLLKTLSTFRPDTAGFADCVVYNQLGTSTGRLVVKNGPHVLTLPKRYRDIMMSRYSSGSVCQVDFVSLEPRIARVISGRPATADIYSSIASTVFSGQLDRDEVKLAVLCALYGVSSRRLQNMLSGKLRASSVIKEIKEYFGVSRLLRGLKSQLKQNGHIENWNGRLLEIDNPSDHILISHFIQSTAVDVAMLGFNSIIDRSRAAGLRFEPTFIIHDALVVDIHSDDLSKFQKIVSSGVDVGELGNFPLELETITGP